MLKRWRRQRQLKKTLAGDGSELRPYRWYQGLTRSAFSVELDEGAQRGTENRDAPRPVQYAVDVRYFADDADSDFDWTFGTEGVLRNSGWLKGDGKKRRNAPPVALYREGMQIRRANLPATFAVPGGVIEVATSMYGVSRMHLVREDGSEQVLRPFANSPEGIRARVGTRFPRLHRAVGILAVAVLLVGLTVAVPQILEQITSIPAVSERVGTFISPIRLPPWANLTITVLGVIAALERALTLRNHWLVDFDTTWLWGT